MYLISSIIYYIKMKIYLKNFRSEIYITSIIDKSKETKIFDSFAESSLRNTRKKYFTLVIFKYQLR